METESVWERKSSVAYYTFISILLSLVLMGCAPQAFKQAHEVNTVESYDQFLKKYGSNKELASKAIIKKEKAWFTHSKEEDTIDAYDEYLSEYPDGIYYKEAKKLIETLQFVNFKEGNTIEAYDKYLSEYPDGKYYNISPQIV